MQHRYKYIKLKQFCGLRHERVWGKNSTKRFYASTTLIKFWRTYTAGVLPTTEFNFFFSLIFFVFFLYFMNSLLFVVFIFFSVYLVSSFILFYSEKKKNKSNNKWIYYHHDLFLFLFLFTFNEQVISLFPIWWWKKSKKKQSQIDNILIGNSWISNNSIQRYL